MKTKTVPISRRALIARINRKLRDKDEVLKASRGERAKQDVGDYFIVDNHRNAVVRLHCDLDALGRELEVLAPYERLTDED